MTCRQRKNEAKDRHPLLRAYIANRPQLPRQAPPKQQHIRAPSIAPMTVWRSVRRKSLFFASVAAFLIVGGDSFVQGKHLWDRSNSSNKKTMCFSSTKDDESKTETGQQNESIQRQTWNPFRLAVLRLGLTEFPMTSPLNYGKYDGEFTCSYCGNLLFDSNAKYDSGSGWPSFWRSATETSMDYRMEMDGRLECRCQKCKSHLGHVFLDGPTPSSVEQPLLEASPESDPRGRTNRYLPRFCINGAAMKFRDRDSQ